jgi:transcription elongation factor GreB
MGRWRPPPPKSSNYITPEGADTLRRELDHLWKTKRPAVTRAVSEAAAQGDRSENAEYIYGKKQLAEIDRRVRYLRKRFDGMRIVDQPPSDTSKIFFGAWFELEDGADTHAYRLVGPDEVGFDDSYISMDSPLGKAAMGKAVGDEFVLRAPQGERQLRVTAVSYRRSEGKKKPGTSPGESQGEIG